MVFQWLNNLATTSRAKVAFIGGIALTALVAVALIWWLTRAPTVAASRLV